MAMQRWPQEPKAALHQRADRAGDIGVRQHHRVVLGAAQRLHPFVLRAAGVIDVFRHRRRTDEAYRFDAPVMQQRLHRFAIAVDHVEHPRRQPGFRRQPCDIQRGGRHALGRLQHESVAARHRHRPHPQRHHRREVERRDARHHPQRLKLAPAVDARAGLFAVFALQQFRHIAGVFDILDAALQFAQGVAEHLAVLGGDQLADGIGVLLQQILELHHDTRALQRRGVAPGGIGLFGGGDGALHRGAVGQLHLLRRLAGGRVVNRLAAFAADGGLAVDPMGNGHGSLLIRWR